MKVSESLKGELFSGRELPHELRLASKKEKRVRQMLPPEGRREVIPEAAGALSVLKPLARQVDLTAGDIGLFLDQPQ